MAILQDAVDEFVTCCFVRPQLALAQRSNKTQDKVKLDTVKLTGIKFNSLTPVRSVTMTVLPVIVRLEILVDLNELPNLIKIPLDQVVHAVQVADSTVGCWTLVHDVRGNTDKGRPTWRLAAEVGPRSLTAVSWNKSLKNTSLLLDVIAVGIFIGRVKKKEQEIRK